MVNESILIVDDIPENLRLLSTILTEKGYVVRKAIHGKMALASVEKSKPDLILLDIKMPGIDGYQVCETLKSDVKNHDIPIIFLSALDDVLDKVRAFEVGAIDYITKPFEAQEVLVRVENQLTIGRQRQQLIEQNQRLQSELNEAGKYVRSLLPAPLTGKMITQQKFIPSRHLGGDIFDYYWLDEKQNYLALYLLDVSGHGVKSALLSVSIMNLLRTQSLQNADFFQPGTVLKELNRIFPMETIGGSYFTIWYGVYNRSKQELLYSCGGHPPGILVSSIGEVKKLGVGNLAIGLFPEVDYPQECCFIDPESSLYLYSDGVYEIYNNLNNQIWGLEGLIELMTKFSSSASDNLDKICYKIQVLSGKPEFEDDFSLLQIYFA